MAKSINGFASPITSNLFDRSRRAILLTQHCVTVYATLVPNHSATSIFSLHSHNAIVVLHSHQAWKTLHPSQSPLPQSTETEFCTPPFLSNCKTTKLSNFKSLNLKRVHSLIASKHPASSPLRSSKPPFPNQTSSTSSTPFPSPSLRPLKPSLRSAVNSKRFDDRLIRAAQLENLITDNPNHHP